VRVIKPATLLSFGLTFSDATASLESWLAVTEAATWKSIQDVRQTYPHADAAVVASGATVTIFNIRGNRYRLITSIHYNRQIVFIRDLITHAEYSRDHWKCNH